MSCSTEKERITTSVLFHFTCNPEQNKQELRQIPRSHFFLEWLCGKDHVLNQSTQVEVVPQLDVGHLNKQMNFSKFKNAVSVGNRGESKEVAGTKKR